MGLQFPRSARLVRSSAFRQLRAEGTSFHGKYMVLSALRRTDAAPAQFGFITSRRVGGAVQRNRVRRRLRELVRAERGRVMHGLWLVLIARQRAVDASFAELRAEWLTLANRARVFLPV